MTDGLVFRLDLVDLALKCGWDVEGTKSAEEFSREGVTVLVQYSSDDSISSIVRSRQGHADEFYGTDSPGNAERLKLWLTGRVAGSSETAKPDGNRKPKKLKWRSGRGPELLRRADGAEVSIATGHRGTYEWVKKDGLNAAYHYPEGVHTDTPVVLVAPQRSWHRAYRACVEHNKGTDDATA